MLSNFVLKFKNISRLTAANTIHATKQITQKLFRRKKHKLGSFHRAANSISKTFQTLFFIDNLFQQVILDSIDSVTDQLFELLLSDMKNCVSVVKYLRNVWKKKREAAKNLKMSTNADINLMKQVKTVIDGAVLVHRICSDLELYFGTNEAFLKLRKITLEWLDSIEHLLHQVIHPREPVKLLVKTHASVSKVTGTTVWFT